MLIIDDDQFFRDSFVRAVGKLGILGVTTSGSARTALEFLEHGAKEVQLVLLDLDIPGMNGVAFLKSIRGSPGRKLAELPVIIVTGHDSEKVRQGMEPFGILGSLGKPPDMAQLEQLLDSVRKPAA